MGSGWGITERCRDIETACGIAAVVMEAHPSVGGEGRQIVMKRCPCGRTRAVMEPEIDATPPQFGYHRDDRRDADPSGDQKMSLGCSIEPKVVARHRDLEEVSDPNRVVQVTRSATTRIFAQHRNAIAPTLGGIVAQRVLPQEFAEPQVDVGAGRKSRQVASARVDEFVPVDGSGEIGDRADA